MEAIAGRLCQLRISNCSIRLKARPTLEAHLELDECILLAGELETRRRSLTDTPPKGLLPIVAHLVLAAFFSSHAYSIILN
jgi:hypothetical protein